MTGLTLLTECVEGAEAFQQRHGEDDGGTDGQPSLKWRQQVRGAVQKKTFLVRPRQGGGGRLPLGIYSNTIFKSKK